MALFVNRLLRKNIHLFVTGSNAKLLSNELVTHLTGRYNKVELYPFSFSEYATYKQVDAKSLTTRAQAAAKNCLNEYLLQGGLPELIYERNKKGYVLELLEAIIRRDITRRFKVRYSETLQQLATYLLDNFTHEYNAKTLAEKFGVSDHTIDTYCHYLQEAFLFIPLHKFSHKSNIRQRNKKIYVVDTAFVSNRPNTISSQNMGWRLENVVFLELKRRAESNYKELFYYRDRSFEVDFVVANGTNVEELYQICYDMSSEKTREREIKGLLRGARALGCYKLTIITFSQEETIMLDNMVIEVVSAARWLAT